MASTSSSSSSSSSSIHEHESIDTHLLRLLVTLINQHLESLLSNHKARKILEAKCFSNLLNQHSFEFEESVISNLYWGIHNVEEVAIQYQSQQQFSKTSNGDLLGKLEKMFQAPAMLNENEMTAGISNSYLVSCSYFYLAILRKLQNDDLQVALYFLQALLVSPIVVKTEFAPQLYRTLLRSCILPLKQHHFREEIDIVKWGAASYKAWLMYHHVISYGHSPLLFKQQQIRNRKVCSTSSSNSYKHLHLHQNLQKNKVCEKKTQGIKRLQDLLMEDDSDSPTSLYSPSTTQHSEENTDEFDRSLRNLIQVPDTETSPITMSKAPQIQYWNNMNNEEEDEDEEEEEATWQRDYFQRSSTRREEISSCGENSYRIEQAEIVEKVISKLCFSQGLSRSQSETFEITSVYEMLASKPGLKYSLLKDVILDQLLMALSTSKEQGVIRASVSILSSIISGNPSVIQEIKKKGLNFQDLSNALKRDVYEAAILIYLTEPSPDEIKSLQLMPTLLRIINHDSTDYYHLQQSGLSITPSCASLMIIQVLVTEFDHSTNNNHLAAITSPKVISSLVDVPRSGNLEETICLAAILVKCMRFDGKCRYYITEFTPFVSLILSNHKHAILAGLEFYHELLRMPRSSSVNLLEQLRERGGINIMCVLLLAIQQTQEEDEYYKLLSASLLLQLDVLEESDDNILKREVAIEAVLESLTCEQDPDAQQLAAFILSNLGGTYTWTGEPCTIAWLVKKAGLNSIQHKNIIKNIDWSDDTLQEYNATEIWSGKVARHITKLGIPVFSALEKGLKSKNKRVSRDCLTTVAWIGCEIVKGPDDLRCLACDMLLPTIEQYVHPGIEFEQRLLACLCIYNYTFGTGMKKVTQFSESVRESLRRLSSITWMAEELLKVADYYMPNKWRISCVHTQVLEANYTKSGAVNSLIYYRGHLFSGYSNGSIKVWDIKGQTTSLVADIKEHKKSVTCFALLEPGNCLLSGSADKTIRIWKMFESKIECIEVITTKEAVQSVDSCGEMIFAVTNNHRMKVFDSSRKEKDVLNKKHVKCISVSQGKVYIGCMDSSIQELSSGNKRQQEIKLPSKSWRMQKKPINSIAVYKDWLYSASTCVDGSRIKDWRRDNKGQVCIISDKKSNVVAMSVVEDFIYFNTTSSPSSLEIWLRGTEHKVGRLSAGSKITSMLTANDIILCGTQSGLIKGWIPL